MLKEKFPNLSTEQNLPQLQFFPGCTFSSVHNWSYHVAKGGAQNHEVSVEPKGEKGQGTVILSRQIFQKTKKFFTRTYFQCQV